MKKLLLLFVLFSVYHINPVSAADSDWKTNGFTEIEFISQHPFREPSSVSTTDDSFDVFMDTLPVRSVSYGTYASNNTLSLNQNFDINVKYHQSPESYNRLNMSIGIGITGPDFVDFGLLYFQKPSSPTNSVNGSIRILYDSKNDRITSWQSSLDNNNQAVTQNTGTIENFKKDWTQFVPDLKDVHLAFAYGHSYNEFEDAINPLAIEHRSAGFSNLQVTAAPEPITTTLFMVGGGIMAMGKLRKKTNRSA